MAGLGFGMSCEEEEPLPSPPLDRGGSMNFLTSPRFGGTEGGSLFDGKLAFEDTDDFIRISCRLQRTPRRHLGKL